MSEGLGVSGGVGGVQARLDDMLAVAGLLDGVGDVLRSVGLGVGRVAVSPDLVASLVFSPMTGARVEGMVGGMAAGFAGQALAVEAHALWLRGVVEGYQLLDAALAGVWALRDNVTGFAVGWALGAAPVLALGAAVAAGQVAAVGAVVGVMVAGSAVAADTVFRFGENFVESLPPWPLSGFVMVTPVWMFTASVAAVRTADDVEDDVADAQEALAEVGAGLLGAVREALPVVGAAVASGLGSALFDFPGTVDVLTGGSPGLVTGLSMSPLGVLFGVAGGGPAVKYEDAIARLRAVGNTQGVFADGTAAVRPAPQLDPNQMGAEPTSFETLFSGVSSLGMPGNEDAQAGPHAGRVRVFEVPQPDGSSAWVVEVPGTQVWPMEPGSNPLDLAGNVNVMTDGTSTAADGVRLALREAMASAGVPPGQPVLLSGHSQGGIVAGALAADPGFRSEFNVQALVTGGSPIARLDIPDSVTVLSLEHTQDPVPRLDGDPNPDRSNWTTVSRDVRGAGEVDPAQPISAHNGKVYTDTAALVDASTDPSLVATREALSPFLSGGGTSTDWTITRTTP